MKKKGSHLKKNGSFLDAKKVRFQDSTSRKLTPTETEILALYREGFSTAKKIAICRQKSLRSVQRHLHNIQKKGHSLMPQNDGSFFRDHSTNLLRLHGEQYTLNLINLDRTKYMKQMNAGNRRIIENNTIELNRNNIEVYSGHSFWGEDVNIVDSKAMKYWVRFFTRLEYEFGVILVKERRANISRVSAHYSETNNELADKCLNESQKVRVVGDDGKTWLVIDNSFNLKELETIHPTEAKHDMRDVVKPFFNDLRKRPTTLSEVTQVISKVSEQLRDLTTAVTANAHTLSSVLELISPKEYKDIETKHKETIGDYIG